MLGMTYKKNRTAPILQGIPTLVDASVADMPTSGLRAPRLALASDAAFGILVPPTLLQPTAQPVYAASTRNSTQQGPDMISQSQASLVASTVPNQPSACGGYSKVISTVPGPKRGRKRGRSKFNSKAHPFEQDEAPRRQAGSNAATRHVDGVIGAEQSSSQHTKGSLSLGHAWDCSSASEEQDSGDMDYVAADQGYITAGTDLLFAALPLEPDEAVVERPMVRSIYRTCGAAAAEAEEDEDESSEMLWQPVEDAGSREHHTSHRGCNNSWGARCSTNHHHSTDAATAAERRKAARNTHCPSFVRTGHCVRGNTCAFLHCQHTFEERRPAMGRWGNPLRPEELTCPVHLKKYGSCTRGILCPHHHPDPEV